MRTGAAVVGAAVAAGAVVGAVVATVVVTAFFVVFAVFFATAPALGMATATIASDATARSAVRVPAAREWFEPMLIVMFSFPMDFSGFGEVVASWM